MMSEGNSAWNPRILACEQALLFGQGFAARSRVLARLVLLAQIGELARRLANID